MGDDGTQFPPGGPGPDHPFVPDEPDEPKPVGGTGGTGWPKFAIPVGVVVLIIAAFFIGQATGSTSTAKAAPAATVRVTVTATPPAATAPPTATDTAAGAVPTGTGVPTGTAAAGAPGATPVSTAAPGTQLGSYSFRMPGSYYAPLGTSAPTQQMMILSQSSEDVIWNDQLGGAPLNVGNGDKMFGLANGATPTYQSCTTDMLIEGSASDTPGTAFCVLETTGRWAGVTVTSADTTSQTWSMVLHVTLWQGAA